MKTFFALICILAAGLSPLRGQEEEDFGAGLIIGDPTGITGKFWLKNGCALDGGVGLDGTPTLYGDYLWHSWKVLPQTSGGKFPAYLGVGVQIGNSSHDGSGLRLVAGAAYWLPRNPLEIFLELVPLFRFSSDDRINLNLGLGLRYYFR